jgi:hypothetical protein
MNPIISADIIGSSSALVSQQHPYDSAWSAYDSNHGSARLAHASTPLHLFDEFFCFFEPNAGGLPIQLYRFDFLIGPQRLDNIWGHMGVRVEFDVRLLEEEIELRLDPTHCPDPALNGVKSKPNGGE